MICTVENDTPVGCIDLFDFDPLHQRAGVGVLIAKVENREKGYASEALHLLISHAFENMDLHQLFCNVGVDNEASITLFQRQGFEICGTKKQWNKEGEGWKDEYLMQLIKSS